MEMDMGGPDLQWLLGHELRLSARHRRFASLVVCASLDAPAEFDGLLRDVIRESDVLFVVDAARVVLMCETDGAGACAAAERYEGRINGSMAVRYGVSSYPVDGKSPEEVLDAAWRRLDAAKLPGSGCVVSEG